MRLFLAGPLFNAAERDFNRRLRDALVEAEHEVWLPQEKEPRERSGAAIFKKDVEGIEWAAVVVANMDGPDPDSGTCWECGYAYAKKKPVLAYRTDLRHAEDAALGRFNLMIEKSATKVLLLPGAGVEQVARKLLAALDKLEL
ncbi:MAG: nucleoside 2-deoxyribosyltransferase [Candidatus Koribacter versatilis]|uniref:Nucleoside 2-deoxyribosyltransferase n=1 Tax=Candidatus Korobacter versatilis TaxID=658062 RepID=A0A932A874_9BACT|nr:nucleoside 2-deoxyribosyltransferase [Candidatus Koribacter versatilis]